MITSVKKDFAEEEQDVAEEEQNGSATTGKMILLRLLLEIRTITME